MSDVWTFKKAFYTGPFANIEHLGNTEIFAADTGNFAMLGKGKVTKISEFRGLLSVINGEMPPRFCPKNISNIVKFGVTYATDVSENAAMKRLKELALRLLNCNWNAQDELRLIYNEFKDFSLPSLPESASDEQQRQYNKLSRSIENLYTHMGPLHAVAALIHKWITEDDEDMTEGVLLFRQIIGTAQRGELFDKFCRFYADWTFYIDGQVESLVIAKAFQDCENIQVNQVLPRGVNVSRLRNYTATLPPMFRGVRADVAVNGDFKTNGGMYYILPVRSIVIDDTQ